MNYIAHLHIASVTQTSLVGNFLGDFIKGSDLSHLQRVLQVGVMLHRKVDSYTDTHPETRALKDLFPAALRKFAGIGLDIYFDHLLIEQEQWLDYPAQYALFEGFYRDLDAYSDLHGQPFSSVRRGLLARRWLVEYRAEETCLHALYRVEERFKNKRVFAENVFGILSRHKGDIADTFNAFYPDLLEFSESQAHDITQTLL